MNLKERIAILKLQVKSFIFDIKAKHEEKVYNKYIFKTYGINLPRLLKRIYTLHNVTHNFEKASFKLAVYLMLANAREKNDIITEHYIITKLSNKASFVSIAGSLVLDFSSIAIFDYDDDDDDPEYNDPYDDDDDLYGCGAPYLG